MAQRAQALTRRHFGRTVSLYVPLYLSNHCPGGCAYCGFASDRRQPRRRLEPAEAAAELDEIHSMGFEEVLLLTGERGSEAGFDYLLDCVRLAARKFHLVTVESFAMTAEEYGRLVDAGCTGITLYQETYDPARYAELHRWGAKRDYAFRLEAPARALAAGMRTVGLGALLGLADPLCDAILLLQHLRYLQKHFWRGGFSVSFPRIRPQAGGYTPRFPVGDAALAQLVFAFRIALPDVPLVLSTRESPAFRDGIAGLGISKMSVASRTTVGGYHAQADRSGGQFAVSDTRGVAEFVRTLEDKGLQPVFKNWDAVLRADDTPCRASSAS
jgi:2-iminoacetate synthase